MNTLNRTIAATTLLMASTGLASAAMIATTVTDMTIYSGPGADYEQVGLATRGSTGELDGCLDGGAWCRIDVNGMRGWVYAENLTVDQGGTQMGVTKYGKAPVVTYEKPEARSSSRRSRSQAPTIRTSVPWRTSVL